MKENYERGRENKKGESWNQSEKNEIEREKVSKRGRGVVRREKDIRRVGEETEN